jgi:hypothetical protein
MVAEIRGLKVRLRLMTGYRRLTFMHTHTKPACMTESCCGVMVLSL